MARVNVDILGISELKWTGMGEFNSDDHFIYYCGQESLRRNGSSHHGQQKSPKCSTWMQSQKWQKHLCSSPRQTIQYHSYPSISLPFHYYFFLTYCVWGLLFPGFNVEFFLPFGFCPPKIGSVLCVSFLQGEICAEFLFFLWWTRLSVVVILSADDWVCVFVLFAV